MGCSHLVLIYVKKNPHHHKESISTAQGADSRMEAVYQEWAVLHLPKNDGEMWETVIIHYHLGPPLVLAEKQAEVLPLLHGVRCISQEDKSHM